MLLYINPTYTSQNGSSSQVGSLYALHSRILFFSQCISIKFTFRGSIKIAGSYADPCYHLNNLYFPIQIVNPYYTHLLFSINFSNLSKIKKPVMYSITGFPVKWLHNASTASKPSNPKVREPQNDLTASYCDTISLILSFES